MFVLGGVLGSFINVVAYRVPRGISLVHPGSCCPACGHPIRWYDNVPMVGWLLLGGRCRDCHARISARYPLVEAAVAMASMLLGWTAIHETPSPAADLGRMFTFDLGTCAFQLLLICTLICAALMEYDGHAAPVWLLGAVLVIGFALGSLWGGLRGVGQIDEARWHAVYEGAAGLLAALVLSALAWPAWVKTARPSSIVVGATAAAELALVGVFLGSRDVTVVAVASMACYALLRAAGRNWRWRRPPGWAAPLAIATLANIVAWPIVEPRAPAIARLDDLGLFIVAGPIVAILALAVRWASRPEPQVPGSHEER
jgi:prepilin signal peptidase PulO-like enzyme (type II secretory pathway)